MKIGEHVIFLLGVLFPAFCHLILRVLPYLWCPLISSPCQRLSELLEAARISNVVTASFNVIVSNTSKTDLCMDLGGLFPPIYCVCVCVHWCNLGCVHHTHTETGYVLMMFVLPLLHYRSTKLGLYQKMHV